MVSTCPGPGTPRHLATDRCHPFADAAHPHAFRMGAASTIVTDLQLIGAASLLQRHATTSCMCMTQDVRDRLAQHQGQHSLLRHRHRDSLALSLHHDAGSLERRLRVIEFGEQVARAVTGDRVPDVGQGIACDSFDLLDLDLSSRGITLQQPARQLRLENDSPTGCGPICHADRGQFSLAPPSCEAA